MTPEQVLAHPPRGARSWARHEARLCLGPPDWSGGYTSIFAAQGGEERLAAE